MKKVILSILVSILVISCEDPNRVLVTKSEYDKLKQQAVTPDYPKTIRVDGIGADGFFQSDNFMEMKVFLIDSCEYIFVERAGNGGPMLTHKGNCKSCSQRMQELVNGKVLHPIN